MTIHQTTTRLVASRLFERLEFLRRDLASFVWPPECSLCEDMVAGSEAMLCSNCASQLIQDYSRCTKCATPVPEVVPKDGCYRCRKAKFRFDQVVTLGPYRGQLRDAVIRLKKPHQWLLRRTLARKLARVLVESLGEPPSPTEKTQTLIVPVPNYWTHSFQGVADTAGEIAGVVSGESGIPLKSKLIRRTRKTAKQGMLSWTERSTNVRGAFQIPSPEALSGCHVILVDDVLTSGATCSEVSRQLKSAGVSKVTVAVIARGTGARESPTPQISDETN